MLTDALPNSPTASPTDRWMISPIIAALAGFAIFVFVVTLPGPIGFSLYFYSLFLLPAFGLLMLIGAILFCAKKNFRRAASLLLAIIAPLVLRVPIAWAANYVHLGLTVWFGFGVLGPIPQPDAHGFAVYDWSYGLVSNGNTFLIRDDTGRISLPMDRQVNGLNSQNGWFEQCAGKVDHLLGHYYLCEF
jgi:hypothetical protein